MSAPQHLVELAKFRAIWTTLCKREIRDIDQNFFDAGGYSLLLLDLQRWIEQEFGVKVGVLKLFKNPTIRSQMKLVDKLREARKPLPATSSE